MRLEQELEIGNALAVLIALHLRRMMTAAAQHTVDLDGARYQVFMRLEPVAREPAPVIPLQGQRNCCSACGQRIEFKGERWQHVGFSQPRHIATPSFLW